MVEILGIGAPFLDHVIHVPDSFVTSRGNSKGGMKFITQEELEKTLQTPSTPAPGGSAANVLRGLNFLNHSCGILGTIGNDAQGQFLENELVGLGIQSYLQKVDLPTGQLICLVTPDGERTFRTFLSSSTAMWSLDFKDAYFAKAKLVHIEGYCLLYGDLAQRALQKSKQMCPYVSFDLANFELVKQYKTELLQLLKNYVDIVFANEAEVLALTGFGPKEGCAFLKSLCPIAIVSMSAQGCWVGNKNTLQHCPAFHVVPLDTTGAGDFFAAGFLHGFLKERTLMECARYGALLASEVVQVLGATLPQNRLQRILKLLQ